MKKYILNPFSMFAVGAILGVLSKIFDIYTLYLGDIFSELTVWILMGVWISIFSDTAKKAAINIFPFCIGMLITYYAAAKITHVGYYPRYIIGWLIVSFVSPLLAYLTWLAKEKGWFAKLISVGIVLVTVVQCFIFAGTPGVFDIAATLLLIYLLFIKKINRGKESEEL